MAKNVLLLLFFRITTMMAVVIGTFVICWSPFAFMFFSFPFDDVSGFDFGTWFENNPWSIEFITGLIALGMKFQTENPNTDTELILSIFVIDGFLNFIVIPSSYLLNTDIIKRVIITEGWCKVFRRQDDQVGLHRIVPAQNNPENGMISAPKHAGIQKEAPLMNQQVPIPTISGNIQAFANKRNPISNEKLENDFKVLMAQNLFSNP